MRLDIDHEVIGRILVERLTPAFEQIGAHDRQQQQHGQTQAECDDLHRARAAAARDVGEAVTPGHTDTGAKPAHQCYQPAADEV